jgi:hypothetical protein
LSASNTAPESLEALEARLKYLSHDTQALEILQSFVQSIGKTKARQQLFNANGALVRPPIDYRDLRARGLIDAQEATISPCYRVISWLRMPPISWANAW